jgi:hypothetical protein
VKAQARAVPEDPQTSGVAGGPHVPGQVAALARPCRTEGCGHTGLDHDIGTRAGEQVRTRCSVTTAAGACGCTIYAPRLEEDIMPEVPAYAVTLDRRPPDPAAPWKVTMPGRESRWAATEFDGVRLLRYMMEQIEYDQDQARRAAGILLVHPPD